MSIPSSFIVMRSPLLASSMISSLIQPPLIIFLIFSFIVMISYTPILPRYQLLLQFSHPDPS